MERSWTRRQRPRGPGGGHPARGISLVELLIVLAIIGMIGLFGVPAIAKMLRRMQGASMVSGVTRVLNTARLAAIKGVSGPTGTGLPAPVVVLIEKGGTGEQIWLRSFVDLNQNYKPDTGERFLDEVLFPEEFSFWKHGGAEDSLTEGAPFNTYRIPGATADDATLVNRVVFLPTGGIAVPQADDSARPTKDAGRGIYFADRDGRNYFRVTIPADSVAKPVAEKWVDATTGYSPAGWVFK